MQLTLTRSAEWLRLARLAKLLAWASLGWLCVEGTVAIFAGVVAGSIALVGFGLDSAIEGTQNLLCAGLAVGVLAGLLGNALFGLWWVDPAAALVISAAAVQGGSQAWRGDGCEACC